MKITKKDCWFVIEILIAVYLIVSGCRSTKTLQETNYAKSVVENIFQKMKLKYQQRIDKKNLQSCIEQQPGSEA